MVVMLEQRELGSVDSIQSTYLLGERDGLGPLALKG